MEMGNSAGIVMRHYFDIVESRAAREYWNIKPLPRGDFVFSYIFLVLAMPGVESGEPESFVFAI